MIMKKIILVLSAILCCVSVFGCEKVDKLELENNIAYSVYENGEGDEKTDMISFYMTSDSTNGVVWNYSLENNDVLEIFHETQEEKEAKNGTANYRTLILKPKAEGEVYVNFELSDGSLKSEYCVIVEKNENGILKINMMEPAL